MARTLVSLLILALVSVMPVRAETATSPIDTHQMQEAVRKMQEGIPAMMRVLDTLGREAPALQTILMRATAKGQESSGRLRVGPNGLPTAESVADQYRGLQNVFEVLREALPVIERMQKGMPGPVQVGPPIEE